MLKQVQHDRGKMNAIDIKLQELMKRKQLGLMTHAVLGYPTVEKSLDMINTLISGSDFLELQIPFSDPVADGETIMKACEVALKNGMNTDRAFEMIERIIPFCYPEASAEGSSPLSEIPTGFFASLRMTTGVPILLMAYYNTVFRYGVDKFCKKARELKVSGLIIPDIPPEEEKSEKFISTCLKYDLYPIRVVSPSCSFDRLKINARYARGFIYCVSHFGVTGSNVKINDDFRDYIKNVKRVIKLPVAVGFGLSKAGQIEKLNGFVDIAIVGSAMIKNYDEGGIQKVSSFIKKLKETTRRKE